MTEELENTKARLREVAAELLEKLMSDISEDHYCAGWNMGLENDLWTIVRHGSGVYGMGTVDPASVQKLKDLSRDAGGWHDGNKLIPIAYWRRQYATWFEETYLPILRQHIEYTRTRVGKKDFFDRVTTDTEVQKAREMFASAEAELPAIKREAESVP